MSVYGCVSTLVLSSNPQVLIFGTNVEKCLFMDGIVLFLQIIQEYTLFVSHPITL